MEKALTTKQVAEILSVTVAHVDKLCAAGILRGFKLSNGKRAKWRIWPRELRLFTARQSRSSRPEKKSLVTVLEENS